MSRNLTWRSEAMEEKSYILTAELDKDSFAWLDALRRQHFPPERNMLSAHLTMFHRLSGAQIECLSTIAIPSQHVVLSFRSIRFLGFGVAFTVQSPELENLRYDIARSIGGELSRQDNQQWTPHMTVQNKAPASAAKDLFTSLQRTFTPRDGGAISLLIWEYLGGPWRLAKRYPFADDGMRD